MSAIKTFFDVTRYAFGPERASSTTRPLPFEPPSDVPATFHPSFTYTTQLFMCAYYGVTGWFFEVDDFATEEQRLYSVSPAAVKVLQTNFAFQTWDFAVSFLHKELNAPEMLAHHSLAALLCYWGLTMPYMHYYAIYFMGVAEVSSVPLVLVDICKYYPEFAKRFPLVDLLSKLAFAAAFLAVRDVFWVYTAVTVWKDGVGILRKGNFPAKYPGYITASVLVANAFFTTLQIVWTGKLLQGAAELFGGKDGEKKKKKK